MLGNAHQDVRVLIVDEFDLMRKLVREMLTRLGFHDVEEVSNAADALDRLRSRGGYGLVIVNDELSVTTGFDLLALVREDESLRTVPFVMMISDARSGPEIAALGVHPASCVDKPFNLWDLKAAIVTALASI
jgi:two-component system chemotaxis response regulator CheY